MRSLLLSVVGLLTLLAASYAAPAPLPPRYAPYAEVEFGLGADKERARRAGLYLRSRFLLEDASKDQAVAAYLPGLSEGQRREWLADRLSVTVGGDRVRLRLRGDAEALGVLRALADRLSAANVGTEDDDRKLLRMVLLLQARIQQEELRALQESAPYQVTRKMIEEAEARVGRSEIDARPLTLVDRPRRLLRR